MIRVREGVRALALAEPTRTHAIALTRRLTAARGSGAAPDDFPALVAGVEYLAARIEHPDLEPEPFAARHGLPGWRMLRVLGPLRERSDYRGYVGDWIREGRPTFIDEPVDQPELSSELEINVPDELCLPELAGEAAGNEAWTQDPDDLGEEVAVPLDSPTLPATLLDTVAPGGEVSAVPARWRAPFTPYAWQLAAAQAWETNSGRGIMQVVTGAGKTALAALLYARLLERIDRVSDLQAIIVVPRIALARQWVHELGKMLDLRGLRVGQYHSEARCKPERQDILVITVDSARQVLRRMVADRPVLLIADECHRLGAPGASRILDRSYQWTLGLSATPERGGDLGFEQVLVPKLGPVVWKYGYKEAVRDGIIARFSLLRVRVSFTSSEALEYEQHSERIKKVLDGIKSAYPQLRTAFGTRFWQVMGDLRQRHPDDDRFDILQAAAAARRDIVHRTAAKLDVVRGLAQDMPAERRTLCFHERIEMAEELKRIVRSAGRRVTVYHSELADSVRSANLENFRAGRAEWLVACRSLDEGLDIRAVDTVVIVAGTKAPRQIIQRLGRALRRKDGERSAAVIMLEVAGVDEAVLGQEGLDELVEAASEVCELDVPGLTAWLSGILASGSSVRAGMAAPSGTAPAVEARLPANRDPQARFGRRLPGDLVSRIISVGRRIPGFRPSWTGTDGTMSYYDKDSGPD